MIPFIICAYYTRGIYRDVYNEHLKKSIDSLKLDNYVKEIEPNFDWFANTRYKPTFALECLRKYPGKNIVVVDVDAKINKYPDLFDRIPEDVIFGAYTLDHNHWYQNNSNNKEVLTGTLFINNSIQSSFYIKEWIKLSIKGNDQDSLKQVIDQYKPKIYELPLEYCYINTLPWGAKPYQVCNEPVIEHFQASRKTKYIR